MPRTANVMLFDCDFVQSLMSSAKSTPPRKVPAATHGEGVHPGERELAR
jgi:hypothetical protein